jgi:hypothetical protein
MQTLQFKMEFYQNYFKLAAAAGKNFSEEKLYK